MKDLSLIEEIKVDEGFRGEPYNDTLGFPTIGYGTKLPLTEEEAEMLLVHRLKKRQNEVRVMLSQLVVPTIVWDMLFNMSYQMGTKGLLGFKKMIKALEKQDYLTAYREGIDSKWYRQTPNRALKVLSVLKKL